jgi:hypothetical protein
MKQNIEKQIEAIKQLNEFSLKKEIVILGSTYMANFPLYELINKSQIEHAVYNRSFEGLTIQEAMQIYKECVVDINPKKVFLSLGEEDQNSPTAIQDYNFLIRNIRRAIPDVQLFLICLNGESEYVKEFNQNIIKQCDGKYVNYIKLAQSETQSVNKYRSHFKQLSCFFREKAISMSEAFAISRV